MFEVMYLSLLLLVVGLASFAMEVVDFIEWRTKKAAPELQSPKSGAQNNSTTVYSQQAK